MEPMHLKAFTDLSRRNTADIDHFYQQNSCVWVQSLKRVVRFIRYSRNPDLRQLKAIKT